MPTGPLTNFPNGVKAGGAEIASGVASALTLAGLKLVTQELTATGAVNAATRVVFLNHASTIIAATLAAPAAGDILIVVNTSASGTAAHTVTLPAGVTWNGTNLIATLNAPGEALFCIATSATRYFVIANLGSVGFSGT
jgi:hypothetical protein